MSEQSPSTTATPMLFERVCLYCDGVGTPIGIGRSWAEARAGAVALSSGIDPMDPERCTPELAAAWGAAHALDGLEPTEILCRTERELLSILGALGVDHPERELRGPRTRVQVGNAVLTFEPSEDHRRWLERTAAGETDAGQLPYQRELAADLLAGGALDRLERGLGEIADGAARLLGEVHAMRRAVP